MGRHPIALFMPLFLLPSCMLDQQAPHPPATPAVPPTVGLVVLADVQGLTKAAASRALFGRVTEAKGILALRAHASLRRAQAADDCTLERSVKKTDSPSAASSVTLISVGKLAIGPALQSTLLPFEESDQHEYTVALTPDFPSGEYQIVAEGAGDVRGFSALLSMPETLKGIKANGTSFGISDVIIKRGEPLKIEWNAPAAPNDSSHLILEILAETEAAKYRLDCQALERDFQTGNSIYHWDLPASVLGKLPATPDAEIRFTRAHERRPKSSYLAAKLQGLRRVVAPASLD